jgi:hypothetical protein
MLRALAVCRDANVCFGGFFPFGSYVSLAPVCELSPVDCQSQCSCNAMCMSTARRYSATSCLSVRLKKFKSNSFLRLSVARMEQDGLEPKMAPSLSRNSSLRLSPIDVAGRSSPQNRDNCGLGSKKRSASQLFNFAYDDLGETLCSMFLSNFHVFAAYQNVTLFPQPQTPQSSSKFFPIQHPH